jgi:hypothetical protein
LIVHRDDCLDRQPRATSRRPGGGDKIAAGGVAIAFGPHPAIAPSFASVVLARGAIP